MKMFQRICTCIAGYNVATSWYRWTAAVLWYVCLTVLLSKCEVRWQNGNCWNPIHNEVENWGCGVDPIFDLWMGIWGRVRFDCWCLETWCCFICYGLVVVVVWGWGVRGWKKCGNCCEECLGRSMWRINNFNLEENMNLENGKIERVGYERGSGEEWG